MLLSSSGRRAPPGPPLRTATNLSIFLKNLPSWKKLPLKLNVNGIVEKPAVPTVEAPGGGFVAVVGPAAGPVVGAPAALMLIVRKSTPARLAAALTWTSSERTSSSAGTALPSRATIE